MAATPPHALVFPFPAQSHVISLLELSYCLLDRGFKITFLNTEFNHRRLLDTLSKEHPASAATAELADGFRLASIPDGLGPAEDRNDIGKVIESMLAVMPGWLEDFMVNGEEKFTCLVADQCMAWALDVAKKVGVRAASIFPASAAVLALNLSIPKLIADGVVDEEGEIKKHEIFQLSPQMPPMHPTQLSWNCFQDSKTRKIMFNYFADSNKSIVNADIILCNTFHELEKPIFAYAPAIVPIGPLIAGSRPNKTAGNFWAQDTKCIEWLDRQQQATVIYVAFGSFTVFNQHQFQELALGLELTGHPFLWVVRPDLTDAADDNPINLSNFIERVGDRGRLVGWCPQARVLAHPSVACFVTHCGWNSTLEGLRNGLPFLCWPYFGDQFLNQTYICDIWRVGLRMIADTNGIYSKEQIRSKLEELISGDVEIKERSLAFKEMAYKSTLEKVGSSHDNFNSFINLIMKGV
ncbi:UDP-glycosyltransferase 83A1 [Platanthera zijinensis]|uniref:UDP-glycosyltransferase 83A1 n=1 Tax=Platanthera zijinensis TaxID=2320716 RepID=A0AAP0B9J4_9ASPA